jgi:hypothetical protein
MTNPLRLKMMMEMRRAYHRLNHRYTILKLKTYHVLRSLHLKWRMWNLHRSRQQSQ